MRLFAILRQFICLYEDLLFVCGLWLFGDFTMIYVGRSFSFLGEYTAYPALELPHQKPRHHDLPGMPPKPPFRDICVIFNYAQN